MSEQLTFWIAALAPLALPLFTPGMKGLAAVTVVVATAILWFGATAPADLWSGFLVFTSFAALLAGVVLRIMLAFVLRLRSGR
jgi:hypothetical protein